MLTRMRVRRHLWAQLRRQSPSISPRGTRVPLAQPVLGSSSAFARFHSDRLARIRVSSHGFSSSSSRLCASKSALSHAQQQEEFDLQRAATKLPKEKETLGGYGGKGMLYGAGAGAALLLTFIAASTGAFNAADAKARVQSGVSKVLDSGAGIGRELVKITGSLKEASLRTFLDVVEAGASILVLVRCLSSVLESAVDNATFEMNSWWRPRVASLLADLAAQENRRRAIVDSGDGSVVDWLLKAVGGSRPACAVTQAEASRALAYLLSDVNTCESVIGRPHALPYLLHFAASLHANDAIESLKSGRKDQVSQEGVKVSRGKSLLVAAIMDLITWSCETGDAASSFTPMLPGKADPADVAAALQVVEGGWLVDDEGESEEKDGRDRGGIHGIGMRVLGGTEIVGVQRTTSNHQSSAFATFGKNLASFTTTLWPRPQSVPSLSYQGGSHVESGGNQIVESRGNASVLSRKGSSDSVSSSYGLWDDLPGRFVAVPLAAWALATWARASNANRSIISELDKEGNALLATVVAPERSVRWHGATTMKFLLQNVDEGFDDVATRWSSALLDMASEASSYQDLQLAHSALTSLTSCISHSQSAHKLVIEKGLPVLRELTKQTESDESVQGAVAQSLDVLTASGSGLSLDEGKKWSPILLRWACVHKPDSLSRSCGCRILDRVVNNLGQGGIPISQAWLAMLLMDIVSKNKPKEGRNKGTSPEARERSLVQSERIRLATAAASELAKVVAREAAASTESNEQTEQAVAESARELPMVDLLGFDMSPGDHSTKSGVKDGPPKVTAREAAYSTLRAVKALTELIAEDQAGSQRIIDAGGLCLLRRLLLCNDFDQWASAEVAENVRQNGLSQTASGGRQETTNVAKLKEIPMFDLTAHIQKHAARLLSILSINPSASLVVGKDPQWCKWLETCAEGHFSDDNKLRSYSRAVLYHVSRAEEMAEEVGGLPAYGSETDVAVLRRLGDIWPRYEDTVYLMNPDAVYWNAQSARRGGGIASNSGYLGHHSVVGLHHDPSMSEKEETDVPVIDVVFVHGLMGGPYRTWRIADDKTSTTNALVEKIDEDAGKEGTCWPEEWLSVDLPGSRLLTVKYKTNLSRWSGATLPLQEVGSIVLDKLLAAGIGERPVVFITHSMGGLVVKQLLLQASQDEKRAHIVKQTAGIIFYSCPHFGSKLADMPWRIGYVLRPAPSIGDLRSGSPMLEELNRNIRQLHTKRGLEVLSFSETKVTPLVEGYGGYALRMEVVPIESAYPGFGDLVVLDGTDHVNSCKPLNRADPAYTKTLHFLQKLADQAGETKEKKSKMKQ